MTPFRAFAAGLIVVGFASLSVSVPAETARVQGSVPGPSGQIRVEVSLVNILASVLDRDNRPAPDLTRDQFEVYEEGKPQKIEVFERETQAPVDLALMIDTSLSELADLSFENEAAAHFLAQVVRPGDRAAVFEFADRVTQLTSFSDDVPRLQSAIRHVVPGDGTAIYDAVYLGSEALARGATGRRRVLVLITDAGETTSRADFETARRAAVRAEALLYTIVVRQVKSEGGRNTAGEHALETIADSTGGALYYPDELSQLAAMFDRIDRELRTQYRLGYYADPRPPRGVYRQIEVRVKGDYTVRSRKSYYSGGPEE
jgi:Ca-activated chloride channel family protein